MGCENMACVPSTAIKKYEIMTFSGKWIQLESFVSSKIRQTREDKHRVLLIGCSEESRL